MANNVKSFFVYLLLVSISTSADAQQVQPKRFNCEAALPKGEDVLQEITEQTHSCTSFFNQKDLKKLDDVDEFESNVVKLHQFKSALSDYIARLKVDNPNKLELTNIHAEIEKTEKKIYGLEVEYLYSENVRKKEEEDNAIKSCLGSYSGLTYLKMAELAQSLSEAPPAAAPPAAAPTAAAPAAAAPAAAAPAAAAPAAAAPTVAAPPAAVPPAAVPPAAKSESANSSVTDLATKYQKQIEQYFNSCGTAMDLAVRDNNSDLLQKLRSKISLAIKGYERDQSRLFTVQGLSGQNLSLINDLNESIDQQILELEGIAGEGSQIPLVANWQSDPYTQQFYAGLNINQVDMESSSTPRIGWINYFRPGREVQKIRETVNSCTFDSENCGDWRWMWPHAYFSAAISSEAEQAAVDSKPDSSLEWEVGLFLPVYIARYGEDVKKMTEVMFGPIYTRGGRNSEDIDGFSDRKYPGLRLAFNEEMYFDILWKGQSEGVPGRRYNFRSQFPVSKVGAGRLFMGVDVNFNSFADNEDNNHDSYNFYIMWQTSFDDLWSAKSGQR